MFIFYSAAFTNKVGTLVALGGILVHTHTLDGQVPKHARDEVATRAAPATQAAARWPARCPLIASWGNRLWELKVTSVSMPI